jgi:nitronate monooxygenase/enoyl-[acyl-carrier protein] reductase II
MLRTAVNDLLGLEYPIIQGPVGAWSSVELAVAVSQGGGLGSIGTALRSPEQVEKDMKTIRERTARPFAVNFSARPFNLATFALTIRARPPVITFAHGDPGELVKEAHHAGISFIQQVNTVEQARVAVERGVDLIIAEANEAAGLSSEMSRMAFLPQVVEVAGSTPVIAAGGIADGRGMGAALLLGAQGVNIGTRLLASVEAQVSQDWKQAVVVAESEDAIKVEFADYVFPASGPRGYTTRPRVLHTLLVEEWNAHREETRQEAERLSRELIGAIMQGRGHELVPFTGPGAGLIHDILPVAEIMKRMVAEAEEALDKIKSVFFI